MSWLRAICLHLPMWLLPLFLTVCAQPDASPAAFRGMSPPDFHPPRNADDQSPTPSPFLRGVARIVTLDQSAGYALLEFEGRQVDAYWQTEVAAAQGGIVAQNDPVRPAVGVYREPEVHVQPLHAKPGDTIAFLGMRTGNSIFLQGVAVISH
jgi:hypothetical protein